MVTKYYEGNIHLNLGPVLITTQLVVIQFTEEKYPFHQHKEITTGHKMHFLELLYQLVRYSV